MVSKGLRVADPPLRALDLAPLLAPRSIAVVGASPGVERHTGRTIANLVRTGYAGEIHPVNPKYTEVAGRPCVASVRDLPAGIDVAYVLVRAELVADVVNDCAAVGIENVVVCTSGFAEQDRDGAHMQLQLSEIARRTGTRIVGPNCIGLLDVPANVVALPTLNIAPHLDAGGLAVVSQSGGMGVNIVNLAQARGIGLRALISVGNECDVDLADAVAALAADGPTRVIALFVEQLRRVDAFLAAIDSARSAGKPVVALKVGAGSAAARSSLGHTGALTGWHDAFLAVMDEIGVATARTLDELVDVAGLLDQPHRPASGRLLIVSPSGGECSYAADRAEAAGLMVAPLSAATAERLAATMRFGNPGNPLDLTGQVIGDADLLDRVMAVLAADDDFDMILFAIPTWTEHDARRLIPVIAGAAARCDKLAAVCAWSARGTTETVEDLLAAAPVPTFGNVDAAMRALRNLAGLSQRQPATVVRPGRTADRASADRVPADWPAEPDEYTATRYLVDAGVPFAAHRWVASASAVEAAAVDLRPPLVVKQLCRGLVHKSDLGLVRLGLPDASTALRAALELKDAALAKDLQATGVLIAEQVDGLEVLVGGIRDPDFGPMIVVGAGGVLAELLSDTAIARCPVAPAQARELIGRLRIGRVLAGYRNADYDLDALTQLVVRASEVFAVSAWMAAFDLNPVVVGPRGAGAHAVDAAIVAARPAADAGSNSEAFARP